ncbi:hypothetical protein RDI58_025092 [Solanum bulbocastanum]|uniref:Proteasome subunit alpha type n=1 Tax=Solanum bulbocastanum TaxID=147425 RepID=A0AAN8Y3Y1_SOLBU
MHVHQGIAIDLVSGLFMASFNVQSNSLRFMHQIYPGSNVSLWHLPLEDFVLTIVCRKKFFLDSLVAHKFTMSRRYDSRTTIFSPEGRLNQVEYAMEAIGNAGSAIGILAKDGVLLVGEKKVTSKLLQTSTSTEKMYKIDDHIACAVAGMMSDANILINTARVQAQRFAFAYQESMPVEQLVQSLCDTKQGYTQFGGLRPFGVSFLFAGWDKNYGFQLYMSDPSGNYSGWKAAAVGANNQPAQSMLKQDYKDDMTRGSCSTCFEGA